MQVSDKINQAIDKDGVKVNIGINTVDAFLLGGVIIVAVVLGGLLLKLLTRNM